jgi:hypothetical protein
MEMPNEEMYYIQDTRTYVGNSVMWWRVGGNGYTTDLKHAWRVPATWRGRETDKLWPCSAIDAGSQLHFDHQKLRDLKPLEARKANETHLEV